MAEMVDLISLWPGADRDLVVHDLRAAALAAGGEAIFLAGSLPAGRNAGDLIMRLRFAGRARPLSFSPALAAAIALRDGAIYDIAQHGGASPQRGLFRTALFAATRRPTAARVATFEAETVAMAGRIAAIRRWALGRVTESWGRHRWTHVWEQTYDGLEGLTGACI